MRLGIQIGVGLAAFAVVASAWHFGASRAGGITPGTKRLAMPELVMTRLDGGVWRMADHRGEVVLVNYWATWCGPCVEETPGLIRVAEKLGPRGLAVVGVTVDEGGREKVEDFVREFHLPYPVTLPQPMSQMAWGMQAIPTTVLVDREGRVAKTYSGAVREPDFERDIEALLTEH